MNNDLISRKALREDLRRFFPAEVLEGIEPKTLFAQIMHDIDNAPAFDLDDFYGKAFRNGEANALATRGIDNSVIGIATVGYEAAKKKYDPIRCRDCKYQIKEFRSDKREKDGGHYVYACKRFGEMFGYWGWGGEDNEFCSDAEQKGGAE